MTHCATVQSLTYVRRSPTRSDNLAYFKYLAKEILIYKYSFDVVSRARPSDSASSGG